MRRRTFLTTGSMAALGFGLSGCATTSSSRPNLVPRRAPFNLPPVKASWDRIIRTTVGLRPHRDAGFVLKPDKLDDKLLVHNYGHGGAGMSLAWGTGLMAAEFALGGLVFRGSVSEQLAGYGSASGAIGLAAQIVFASVPVVQGVFAAYVATEIAR